MEDSLRNDLAISAGAYCDLVFKADAKRKKAQFDRRRTGHFREGSFYPFPLNPRARGKKYLYSFRDLTKACILAGDLDIDAAEKVYELLEKMLQD
jgi:hypothetical protein